MLVCAMNPCKCGWYGHPSGKCKCSEQDVKRYHSRISGPLLDRIDIMVQVPALEYEELRARTPAERSAEIRKRVNMARGIQQQRFSGSGISSNARMDSRALRNCCILSPECEELMKMAFENMDLSARSYDRILRVARTIADLSCERDILPENIAEAIQYRTYDFRDR